MRALSCMIRRFGGDRRGNIAVIFALTMVPTIYLLGMALDYNQALRKQGQLNAAADAAAIAAVRPAMLVQTSDVAKATATAVFGSTANSLPGLTSVPTPTITVTDNGLQRTVTVSYDTTSINNFPSLLRSPAWPISGSSKAQASSLPNMNFYLLLDDSPSMAIGATQDDIDNLKSYTADQPSGSKSCGFACHEVHPNLDANATWTTKDNLSIARTKNVKLRIDLVVNAVTQLLVGPWQCAQADVSGGVMQCMSALNNTSYRAALYTFDYKLNTLQSLASLSTVATQISNIQLLAVDHQNCVTTSNCNTDFGSDIKGALTDLSAAMPSPGLGSNQAGDTPQEVIFLVTDGVEDKIISSSSDCNRDALVQTVSSTQYRCQQPLDTTVCTTIKNKNIRIAILYTEYLQLDGDNWYDTHVAQFNDPSSSTGAIAQNLQSCASPGFYSHVTTGGDISKALADLFIKVASSTASLTH